jgi:hypothetical protein
MAIEKLNFGMHPTTKQIKMAIEKLNFGMHPTTKRIEMAIEKLKFGMHPKLSKSKWQLKNWTLECTQQLVNTNQGYN